MATCLIALGSNLGDKAASLDRAIQMLREHPGIDQVAPSGWLRNPPIGGPDGQDEFINAAARLTTSLSPVDLLQLLHAIESTLGRERRTRWASRVVDLDLLLYDDLVLDTGGVQIPHPRMAFRRFVLQPAAQVAAEMVHPIIGWSVRQMLQHLDNAIPYIAIAGMPGTGKTALAQAVEASTGATFFADPCAERVRSSVNRPHSEQDLLDNECDVLNRRAELIHDGGMGIWGGTVISDFWIGQSLAYANTCLSEDLSALFDEEYQIIAEDLMRPKLLVLLDAGSNSQSRQDTVSGWNCLWSNLLNAVQESYAGPKLVLDASQPAWARTELEAAIRAMQ